MDEKSYKAFSRKLKVAMETHFDAHHLAKLRGLVGLLVPPAAIPEANPVLGMLDPVMVRLARDVIAHQRAKPAHPSLRPEDDMETIWFLADARLAEADEWYRDWINL